MIVTKKICMITTVSITLKTFVVETAKYLYKTGDYDITLICDDDPEFAKSLPEYIHYIPVSMARGIDLSALTSIRRFIRIFRREKFDLIQYATPNASCYASIAGRWCRVPKRLYCQWGIRYVGLSGTSRKIFKTIEKMVCCNSTDIRAVSKLNMAFAIEEGLYPKTKAKVVGNGGTIGVDLQQYNVEEKAAWRKEIREKYAIDENTFVFGFAGRLSVDKGCRELLEAFQKVSTTCVDTKLLIVGPIEGVQGIDAKLLDWAKDSDQVILTGLIPGTEMKKYYASMDVLVHPTYREGFGMVIQEAGALGVPSITTKIPGASEVMEDRTSAYLVEAKNVEELRTAMEALYQDRVMVEELGSNALMRVKTLYERTIMLENQRIDYEGLLS